MKTHSLILLAATTCLVLSGTSAAAVPVRPPAADFSTKIDNQWFPLIPGARYVYAGVKDGKPARDVLTVTHRTIRIDGVPCVVVEDRLYLRGRLGERTTDWYSQDRHGNVWYFGERTAELDSSGRVTSTSGSWTAGVGGARPGIYITATPQIGRVFTQEYAKGEAEDHFKAISLLKTVTGSRATTALLTQEWTPLEPGTIDHKLYVRGIGTVLEQTERGGDERLELVSVTRNA
jgi:hypothetical protein